MMTVRPVAEIAVERFQVGDFGQPLALTDEGADDRFFDFLGWHLRGQTRND